MKYTGIGIVIGIIIIITAAGIAIVSRDEKPSYVPQGTEEIPSAQPLGELPPQAEPAPIKLKEMMKLSSTVFEHGGSIPSKYTCDGANINPPVEITGVPEGTQSLAIIMDDHDVPLSVRADGTWDHWVVFNMPATTTEIGEGKKAPGTYGVGTNRKASYLGPCPPDREHRYSFRLYALDSILSLASGATKA